MKPQRTLPPAAAPIGVLDLFHGISAIAQGEKARERFTTSLQKHFSVKHVFLVSSGKAALYCILKALQKLQPDRNEVLVPAFNCYSVPSAILAAGCKIRLCDVDPQTLDFDAHELSKALTDTASLLCVIPTHLFGLHAHVKNLQNLLQDKNTTIIEDAAQAMGSTHEGECLGLTGDVGFFSLGRGKAFSTYEGGIIVTNNDVIGKSIAHEVATLPEYSAQQVLKLILSALAVTALGHPMLFWIPKGLPFLKLGETLFEHSFPVRKLGTFQAGLAGNWEKKLARLLAVRKANVTWWASFFEQNSLSGISSLVCKSEHIPELLRFPVLIKDDAIREALLLESEKMGLGISKTYPLSLDELPELKEYGLVSCPIARACARTLVTLPVHPFVSKHDREKISKIIVQTSAG